MAKEQKPLVLVCGSPRGSSSNTHILLESLKNGLTRAKRESVTYYIQISSERAKLLDSFNDYDNFLWAFPMYTDAMPGTVKAFWEDLTDTYKNMKGKRFFFLVQMGFPEASQASMLVSYLKWFTRHVGAFYGGTVVRGGVEGIQIQPMWMKKKLLGNLEQLGYNLGTHGKLDETLCAEIAKPYKLKKWIRVLLTFLSHIGLLNMYWNKQLNENEAFNKRFEKPYLH